MQGLGKHDNSNFGSLAKPTGCQGIYFQRVGGIVFKYTKAGAKWLVERIESPLPYLAKGWYEQTGASVGAATSLPKCLEKARAAIAAGPNRET
jgi:hypothetical protein